MGDRSVDGAMVSGTATQEASLLGEIVPSSFLRLSLQSDHRVDMLNSVALQFLGYKDEAEFSALTGCHIGKVIYKDDQERLTREIARQLHQRKELLDLAVRVVCHDGTTRWIQARGRVIFESRRPRYLYLVALDDTAEHDMLDEYRKKSTHDPLTNLLNRGAAQDLIDRQFLVDNGYSTGALLLVDLDNFKMVNDSKGHLAGDSVLLETAQCLMRASRKGDIVARIGGDEFIIYLQDVATEQQVAPCTSRIREGIGALAAKLDESIGFGCSIGVALFPRDGKDYKTLFGHADAALYSGKLRGKGQHVFYEEGMVDERAVVNTRAQKSHRIDSDDDLRHADWRVVHYVLKSLYKRLDTNLAVTTILKIIGMHYNVSRVSIYEFLSGTTSVSKTFEWCADDATAQIDRIQGIDLAATAPGYVDNFDENGIFVCYDSNSLPEGQRSFVQGLDIRSMLQCGIFDQNQLVGFISFDDCKASRYWSHEQIGTLMYISQIVGTVLTKERQQNDLRRHISELEGKVAELRANGEAAVARPSGDPLTGCDDLEGIMGELPGAIARAGDEDTALIMLSLRGIDAITKARGLIFASALLPCVSSCIRRVFKPDDVVGRVGDATFLMICATTSRLEVAMTVVELIYEVNNLLGVADGLETDCAAGMCMLSPGDSPQECVGRAAAALGLVGHGETERYRFYEDCEGAVLPDLDHLGLGHPTLGESLPALPPTKIFSSILSASTPGSETFRILMACLGRRYGVNRISIFMNSVNDLGRELCWRWSDERGNDALADHNLSFLRQEFFLIYWLYDNDGVAVLQRSSRHNYSTLQKRALLDRAGAKSLLVAGFHLNGAYAGMVEFLNSQEERAWSSSERKEIAAIAGIIAAHLKDQYMSGHIPESRAELADSVYKHDSLTGLISMEDFKSQADAVLRRHNSGDYALMALDFANFKAINRAIGYTQGDNVLRMFADSMLQEISDRHFLCARGRLDHFYCLVSVSEGQRERILRRITTLISNFTKVQKRIYPSVDVEVNSGIYFIPAGVGVEKAIERAKSAIVRPDGKLPGMEVNVYDGPEDEPPPQDDLGDLDFYL
ncbi:MAG: diguanylate cyclase [Succinivibrionaceae bacterium]|nr:diguanylate cyclase [Succinivibrionaceae bacterium]